MTPVDTRVDPPVRSLQAVLERCRAANWGGSRAPFLVIATLYLLSVFLQPPTADAQLTGVPHVRVGDFVIAPPAVLSGDSPHYLLIVNSIVGDGDVDLANNYRDAESGGWQAGVRFRGLAIDHHTETDSEGKERSFHSIFLPVLLSAAAWPFRGTQWVEPVCIAFTLAATLAALLVLARRSGLDRRWIMVLALATPVWCYARDIWTEPWLLAIWVGLLFCGSLPLVFALGLAGTLVKYNFVVVVVSMAGVFWLRGERRRAYVLAGAGIVGIALAIATAQYLFQDVDHFNLFHLGGHYHGVDATLRQKIVPLRPRLAWLVGILFDPEAGLLPFFPFLAWGLWNFRKGGPVFVPAIAFFLLHVAYPGWHGGTGFSSRYLVPMLPALVIAVAGAAPRSWLFVTALAYSGFWGIVAGLCPYLVYDRTPLGILRLVWSRLFTLFAG